MNLVMILLEEDPERGQETDNLLLAALGDAPDAACRHTHQPRLVDQVGGRAPLLEVGVVVELLKRGRLDQIAPPGEDP